MNNGSLLKGLDGSNPLAFLAALGTLRTLTLALSSENVKMSWEQSDGAWRPRVFSSLADHGDEAQISNALYTALKNPSPVLQADKRLPFAAARFRSLLRDAANNCNLSQLEWLACLGTDATPKSDDEVFDDTAFRMVRSGDSAGQGMLHYACQVIKDTQPADLHHCLFERWIYRNNGFSFRWDPREDPQYALQANNPSKEGVQSVIGANRLALEALPLFPVYVSRKTPVTLGFRPIDRASLMELRWPIWDRPITLSVTCSLLGLPALRDSPLKKGTLRAAGIATVMSCTQYKPNKYYTNFRPAVVL